MKIALCQMNVIPGRPDKNIENMKLFIDLAKESGSNVIAFPEMCVGGYLLGDKWTDDNWCDYLMSFNEQLKELSDGIVLIYGNVFKLVDDSVSGWHPNQDGRSRKFNAAYIWQNKKPVKKPHNIEKIDCSIQIKTLLPNYRFFDDKRYFSSLLDYAQDYDIYFEKLYSPFPVIINDKEYKIGLELCEDLWIKDYRRHYHPINPTKYFIKQKANVIINISCSSWTYDKNKARDNAIKFVFDDINKNFYKLKNVPFLYVNNVGAQNNGKNIITFDGGSTIYGSDGKIRKVASESYKEEILYCEMEGPNNIDNLPIIERNLPSKIKEKHDAIICGLRYIKDMIGLEEHPKWIIGASGGIDSSLVLSLLVEAFGANKVKAINMPSRYNSKKTKDIAKRVSESLGVKYVIVPIEEIFSSSSSALNIANKNPSQINMENEQSRIRGSVLLAGIAAREGSLFTNNGNKLETALGYATLYGDVNGAICPIADLTKAEIIEMSMFMNNLFGINVIPPELIPNHLFIFEEWQVKPSAELKEEQIDPMKFGYHDAIIEAVMDYRKKSIEDIMQWFLDKSLEKNLGITKELILRWGVDNPREFVKDLDWFFSLIQKNVF
jgi:NAD+ synthase (glutamine-hydrolysing)